VRLIRGGEAPDPATLGEELVRLSGLTRLHELLVWRFARPTQALRVRATLAELETLVRTSTEGGPRIGDLLYQLERTRFGAHELIEIDLADALQSGTLRQNSYSAPMARSHEPGWGWPRTPARRPSRMPPVSD
jgi:hypothetical protein